MIRDLELWHSEIMYYQKVTKLTGLQIYNWSFGIYTKKLLRPSKQIYASKEHYTETAEHRATTGYPRRPSEGPA